MNFADIICIILLACALFAAIIALSKGKRGCCDCEKCTCCEECKYHEKKKSK